MRCAARTLALLLVVMAGCATAATTPPRILILGSPHLAQADRSPPQQQLDRVVDALDEFAPDLVVVEYLPPSWPQGRGRDYRRDFDLARYADVWNLSEEEAAAQLSRPAGAGPPASPCHLGKLHFLTRDFANALYHWQASDCDATADDAIASFMRKRGAHEMARIAMPVARHQGLPRIDSFDYQGQDADWFIDGLKQELEASQERELASQFAPLQEFRDRIGRRFAEIGGDLIAQLRFVNSSEWMDMQRELYEEALPSIRYRRAGAHQTAHYWLRNHRMFEHVEAAESARQAERILVVVGAGHKYFLDELARQAGYDWVDPLEYLPRPSDQTVSASSDTAS